MLLIRVGHEVVEDDAALDQRLDIKLLFENGLNQSVLLICAEALEGLAPGVLERQRLVLVLQLNFELLVLRNSVQDAVREEDEDDDFIFWR